MLRFRSAVPGRSQIHVFAEKTIAAASRRRGLRAAAAIAAGSALLAGCSANLPVGGGYSMVGVPYVVNGQRYVPREDPNYNRVGVASWYGEYFHGRLTANGETYDMNRITAAHTTLPLPSYVKVTNLENGSSIVVRLNDRGPFADDRIIDLSRRTAELLGMQQQGLARVRVEYLGPAPLEGDDERMLLATYQAPGAPDIRVAYDAQSRTVTASTGGLFQRFANNTAPPPATQPAALTGGDDPLAALLAQTYAPLPALTAAEEAAGAMAAGAGVVVQIGIYGAHGNATRAASELAAYGTVTIEEFAGLDGPIWSVRIATAPDLVEAVIAAAAALGAPDAHLAP